MNIREFSALVFHQVRTIMLAPVIVLAIPCAQTQTFTVLYTFKGRRDGATPVGIAKQPGGNLYGTAARAGAFDYGVIFKLTSDGTEKVLHQFDGADGMYPGPKLSWDRDGNLYGTALEGGSREGGECRHGCGEAFRLDPSGNLIVLHAFKYYRGGGPTRVVRDSAGNLYGTATIDAYAGTVFKLDPTGQETVLYDFTGGDDGAEPFAGVIRDGTNNLYGAAFEGGNPCRCGTVYTVDKDGNERTLYQFTGSPDGDGPLSPLIRDAVGNLYGTTWQGGTGTLCPYSDGCGTIFKLDSTGKETILYSFSGGSDGSHPYNLVRDKDGNLYGTATQGGATNCGVNGDYGCGTIFKLDPSGKFTVLHTFSGGAGGSHPNSLLRDAAGVLYGTTEYGGKDGCYRWGCGIVYKIMP